MCPAHSNLAQSVAGIMNGNVDADCSADFELAGPGNGGDDRYAAADRGEQGKSTEVVQLS